MCGILRTIMLATVVLGVAGNALVEDWKLARDEDSVKVYLSSVQSSKYKAYRGITDIRTDVATIETLQEDAKGSRRWIHVRAEVKLLKQEGADAWICSRTDIPWPVTGRDVVIHAIIEKTANGTAIRHLKADPTHIPKEKGQIHVPKPVGEWKLQPKGQDMTRATYQVETELGGSIPSWLANSFAVDASLNTLKGLRSVAEKR